MKIWIRSGALLFFSLAASGLAIAQAQPPVAISLCDLKKDPKTYDGKQIRVRGKINLEFEDFTFYDLSCNADSPDVWLMFGGDVATPITSMWGDTRRPAGKNMTLYGKEFPLIQDASFDDFVRHGTAREKKRPVYRVTAIHIVATA